MLCLILIFTVVFLLIPDPWINIPVGACVVLSVLCAIGMFHWFDMTVNTCTACWAVLSIGLAVDYSAHIGHMYRFSNEDEEGNRLGRSGNERSIETTKRIGTSVFNAATTTFLAVLVLSQAKSFVFYTFFQVLALINVLCGSTGLFVLPVILAIVHGGSKPGPKDELALEDMDKGAAAGVAGRQG